MQSVENSTPMFGDLYLMRFDGFGSEQSGIRPGIVFQNNTGNTYSPNVIAIPLTRSLKKIGQPTHVLISAEDSDLMHDSMALCENPERMSKEKLIRRIGHLSEAYMREVCIASLIATGALACMSEEDVLAVRQKSVQLNTAA